MSEDSTTDEPPRPEAAESRPHPVAYYAVGATLLLVIAWFSWPPSTAADESNARFVAPEVISEDNGPHETSGDDGEVEIEEKGFSVVEDNHGDDLLSWGAMLTNSSELSAARVTLEVRLLDKDDEPVTGAAHPPDVAVPEILPGEKAGFGDVVFPDSDKAASLDIQIGAVEWTRMDGIKPPLSQVRASELSTEWVESSSSGLEKLRIDFQVESQYDHVIEPGAAAVFRDENDEIVGGSPPSDMDTHAVVPPGWSEQYITVDSGPPDNTDEDAIEVYVYT